MGGQVVAPRAGCSGVRDTFSCWLQQGHTKQQEAVHPGRWPARTAHPLMSHLHTRVDQRRCAASINVALCRRDDQDGQWQGPG